MKLTLKKRTLKWLGMGSLGILFLMGMLMGLFSSSFIVYGANNTSVFVTLNITNTEPNIFAVTVSPNPLNLIPGGNTTVNCTAYYRDIDGYSDIAFVNATLYKNISGKSGVTDRNHRYTNTSCEPCLQYNGDPNNGTCSCLFSVDYYADNGTWACNISLYDTEFANDSNISYLNVNPLIAISTPSSIDYGNVTVLETTPKKPLNITNFGNVPINITFRSYAGIADVESNQNWSFTCGLNNISYSQHRWSVNPNTNFDDMTATSNSTVPIGNMTLDQRINDGSYGSDLNATYFQLRVPLSVGGHCNGTMLFQAEIAS